MTTVSATPPRLPWDAADPYPFYERQRRGGDVVWDETSQSWLILGYHAARQVLGDAGWASDPLANPRTAHLASGLRVSVAESEPADRNAEGFVVDFPLGGDEGAWRATILR